MGNQRILIVSKLSLVVAFCIVLVQCDPHGGYGPLNYDQDASSTNSDSQVIDGRISIEQPKTFGAAFQAEVQRLQRLNEVFPDRKESFFSPYGDRTIVALQFPRLIESEKLNGVSIPPPPVDEAGAAYGLPVYGIPQKLYLHKKPTKHLKKAKDFGVIISQNYVYRRNVRDFGNFSKIFENSRPSQDVLQDVAKMLVIAQQMKESTKKSSSSGRGGGVPNSLASLLNSNVLYGLSQGQQQQSSQAFDAIPPIHPQGWDWEYKQKPKPVPSFVLVCIESRVKVSASAPGQELSLTNGSLIFPSPSNPKRLVHVPFILRQPGDVEQVFAGEEQESSFTSYGGEGNKGLIPPEKKASLLSFLKLVEGIHSDGHEDGKERLHRARKLSESLPRPRLPKTNLFVDDPLEEEDAKARETLWLYTSTIALRSVTPPPEKKLYPIVTLVPIVESYREHPLNVIDIPLLPVLAPLPPLDVVDEQPSYGDVFLHPQPYLNLQQQQLDLPEIHYSTLQNHHQPQEHQPHQSNDDEYGIPSSNPQQVPSGGGSSSSSSYFYRTIKESK